MVMVPFAASTWPVFSNCTGPTKLRLVSEGGGPKYDRGTVVPTEGGAGNKLHPGPGPIGPGPGPWSELKVFALLDPPSEEPPEPDWWPEEPPEPAAPLELETAPTEVF